MAFVHTQYNDPIDLYSKQNVREAYHQATGAAAAAQPSGPKEFDPSKSRVLQYLQEEENIPPPPKHSARIDEPPSHVTSEYPHYKGFVDPHLQSPSFHRLEHHTDRVGREETTTASEQTSTVHEGGSVGHAIPLGPPVPAHAPGHGPSPGVPLVSPKVPKRAEHDPVVEGIDAKPLDPEFAAKIAEAEKSKVPPARQPSWTQRAEQKHEKWQHLDTQAVDQRYKKYFDAEEADWSSKAHSKHGKWEAKDLTNVDERYKKTFDIGTPSWAPHADSKHQKWQTMHTTTTTGTGEQHGSETPSWAKHAEQKHHKWEHYSGSTPIEQNKQYHTETPSWAGKTLQTSQDKWDKHYSHYQISEGHSGTDHHRASSLEPGATWRKHTDQVEYRRGEWMKPYIAPNVRNYRYTPGDYNIKTSHSTGRIRQTKYDTTSGATHGGTTGRGTALYGTSYGTGSGGAISAHSPREYQRSYSSSSARDNKYGTWHSTTRKDQYHSQSTTGGATHGQPHHETHYKPIAAPATSPWGSSRTTSDYRTQSTHYMHDSSAEKQKRVMEEELRQRSLQSKQHEQHSAYQTSTQRTAHTGSSGTDAIGWRKTTVPHEGAHGGGTTKTVVIHRGDAGTAAALPQWSSAEGAQTKATTSGTYDDPEGHKVHYTKEVYTSSDPGKEFSMLTEEEKKVMEQPLQPGVISRHVTTKYYKKSTYTSSTTTGTTATGAIGSTARLPGTRPLMIDSKPSQMSPGVSQF